MQACFIAVQESTHGRKTRKAEAGRLSPRASREVFLQASPRRWLLWRQASALWDDGGVAPCSWAWAGARRRGKMERGDGGEEGEEV